MPSTTASASQPTLTNTAAPFAATALAISANTPNGRRLHHDADDLEQHRRGRLQQCRKGLARLARHHRADPDQDRDEDQREHVALGQRLDDVERNDADQLLVRRDRIAQRMRRRGAERRADARAGPASRPASRPTPRSPWSARTARSSVRPACRVVLGSASEVIPAAIVTSTIGATSIRIARTNRSPMNWTYGVPCGQTNAKTSPERQRAEHALPQRDGEPAAQHRASPSLRRRPESLRASVPPPCCADGCRPYAGAQLIAALINGTSRQSACAPARGPRPCRSARRCRLRPRR